jgi:23S rRNA (adenine2030-N6)-methyltransferase
LLVSPGAARRRTNSNPTGFKPLNYRHVFHAGNFADLVKHAALLLILRELTAQGSPLTVIDTHAGRGVYDLTGPEARKSGEAQAGIARLMTATDAPSGFAPLTAAVRKLNNGGGLSQYPGSPWMIADALRQRDSYLACELRHDEQAALQALMRGRRNVSALCADGYLTATARCPATGRVLVLIDPPFERADDYRRIVETLGAVRRRNDQAMALVWLPLKDLETFDAFLRDLEDHVACPVLVVETRMRPLSDPMRMNGCALVALGTSASSEAELAEVCAWTARTLGAGGVARVSRLSGR